MTLITEGLTPDEFVSTMWTNFHETGTTPTTGMTSTQYISNLNDNFKIYNTTHLTTNDTLSVGMKGINFFSLTNGNLNKRFDTYDYDFHVIEGLSTFVPAIASNDNLARYKAFKLGGIIHFSIFTFQYTATRPWNPYIFTTSDIDVDTWVAGAADVGIEYLVLTIYDASGFALFDNPYQPPDYLLNQVWGYKKFDIALAGGDIDLIDKFLTACQTYGIEPVLYIGTVANMAMVFKRSDYTGRAPYVVGCFTETDYQYWENYYAKLMQYIVSTWNPRYVWLDIAGDSLHKDMQIYYDAIKNIKSDCTIIGNTIGDQSFSWYPYDIGSDEENYSLHDAQTWDTVLTTSRSHGGTTYYVPQELVANIFPGAGTSWYWNNQALRTQASIQTLYDIAKAHSCPFLLCLAPNTSGIIPVAQFNLFNGISL